MNNNINWLNEDQLTDIYDARKQAATSGDEYIKQETDRRLLQALKNYFGQDTKDLISEVENTGMKPSDMVNALLRARQEYVKPSTKTAQPTTAFQRIAKGGAAELETIAESAEGAKPFVKAAKGELMAGVAPIGKTYKTLRKFAVGTGTQIAKGVVKEQRKISGNPTSLQVEALVTHTPIQDKQLGKKVTGGWGVENRKLFEGLSKKLDDAEIRRQLIMEQGKIKLPSGQKTPLPSETPMKVLWEYLTTREQGNIDPAKDNAILKMLAKEGLIPPESDLAKELGPERTAMVMSSLTQVDPKLTAGPLIAEKVQWLKNLQTGLNNAIGFYTPDEKAGMQYATAIAEFGIPGVKEALNSPQPLEAVKTALNNAINNVEQFDPSWQMRGEVKNLVPRELLAKYPKIAGALDAAAMDLGQEYLQELYDPNEWLFDAAIGAMTTAVLLIPVVGPVLGMGVVPLTLATSKVVKKGAKALGKMVIKVPKGVKNPNAWFKKFVETNKGKADIMNQAFSNLEKQDDATIKAVIQEFGAPEEDIHTKAGIPATATANQYQVVDDRPKQGLKRDELLTLTDTQAVKKGKVYTFTKEDGTTIKTGVIKDMKAFFGPVVKKYVPEKQPARIKPTGIVEKAARSEYTGEDIASYQAGRMIKQPRQVDIDYTGTTEPPTLEGTMIAPEITPTIETPAIAEPELPIIPEEAPAKEAWQMTKEEFRKTRVSDEELAYRPKLEQRAIEEDATLEERQGWNYSSGEKQQILGAPNVARGLLDSLDAKMRIAEKRHKTAIQQAISEGKPVPPEVLAEYPDLAKAPEGEGGVEVPEQNIINNIAQRDYSENATRMKITEDDYKQRLIQVATTLEFDQNNLYKATNDLFDFIDEIDQQPDDIGDKELKWLGGRAKRIFEDLKISQRPELPKSPSNLLGTENDLRYLYEISSKTAKDHYTAMNDIFLVKDYAEDFLGKGLIKQDWVNKLDNIIRGQGYEQIQIEPGKTMFDGKYHKCVDEIESSLPRGTILKEVHHGYIRKYLDGDEQIGRNAGVEVSSGKGKVAKDTQALSTLGYNEKQIERLTPEEAQRAISEAINAKGVSVMQNGKIRQIKAKENVKQAVFEGDEISKDIADANPDIVPPKLDDSIQPARNTAIFNYVRDKMPARLYIYQDWFDTLDHDTAYRKAVNDIKYGLDDLKQRDAIIDAYSLTELPYTIRDTKKGIKGEIYDSAKYDLFEELEGVLAKEGNDLYITKVIRPAYQDALGQVHKGLVSVKYKPPVAPLTKEVQDLTTLSNRIHQYQSQSIPNNEIIDYNQKFNITIDVVNAMELRARREKIPKFQKSSAGHIRLANTKEGYIAVPKHHSIIEKYTYYYGGMKELYDFENPPMGDQIFAGGSDYTVIRPAFVDLDSFGNMTIQQKGLISYEQPIKTPKGGLSIALPPGWKRAAETKVDLPSVDGTNSAASFNAELDNVYQEMVADATRRGKTFPKEKEKAMGLSIKKQDPFQLDPFIDDFLKRNMSVDQIARLKENFNNFRSWLDNGMGITIQRDLRRTHPEYWDAYRRMVLPCQIWGNERAGLMFADIIKGLNRKQRVWLDKLIALKHIQFSTMQNGIAPGGFTIDELNADVNKIVSFLTEQQPDGSLFPDREAVLRSEDKFLSWNSKVAKVEIERGKLSPTMIIATERPFEFYETGQMAGDLITDPKTGEPLSATGEPVPYKVIDTTSRENYYLRELVKPYTRTNFKGVAAGPSIPKRGVEPYTPWRLKKQGTTKDIFLDFESLMNGYAQIFAAQRYEQFILDEVPKWDRFAMLDDVERKAFMDEHGGLPQPSKVYNLADPDTGEIKEYYGWQTNPGNQYYTVDGLLDSKALVQALMDCISETHSANAIEGKTGSGDIEQVKALLQEIYDSGDIQALDSFLRQFATGDRAVVSNVLAVGRKNRVILVDKITRDMLQNLKDAGDIGEFMAHVMNGVRWYKRTVLRPFPFGAIGIPYHYINMLGDIYNIGRILDIDALKWATTPMPGLTGKKTPPLWELMKALWDEGGGKWSNPDNIPDWYIPDAPYEQQNTFLGKALAIIKEEEVVSSGLTGEAYARGRVLSQGNRFIDFMRGADNTYWRLSSARETIPRATIVLDLLDKHMKGQLDAGSGSQTKLRSTWMRIQRLYHRDANVLAPELFDIDMIALYRKNAVAAIGTAAREIPVDSLQVNYSFRRYIRSLFMPFATWPIMNAGMWARYAKEMPGGLVTKFITPEIIRIGINYSGDREEVERSMSIENRARNHWVLSGKDDRGLAKVMFLETPSTNALSLLGLNQFPYLIWDAHDKVKEGADINKVAMQLAKDMGNTMWKSGLKQVIRMTPLAKLLVGAIANKDYVLGGGQIMPTDPETGDIDYMSPEFAYWLTANIAPQVGAAYVNATTPEDILRGAPELLRRLIAIEDSLGIRTMDVERGKMLQQTQKHFRLEAIKNRYMMDVEGKTIRAKPTPEDLSNFSFIAASNLVMQKARDILGKIAVKDTDVVSWGDQATMFTRKDANQIAKYITSEDFKARTEKIYQFNIDVGIRNKKKMLPEEAMIEHLITSVNFLSRLYEQQRKSTILPPGARLLPGVSLDIDARDSARQKLSNLKANKNIIESYLRAESPTTGAYIREQPEAIQEFLEERGARFKQPLEKALERVPKPVYNRNAFDNLITR